MFTEILGRPRDRWSGPDWLGDPDIAIYSVMLMLIWLQIGYPVVIFMAALQRIDPSCARLPRSMAPGGGGGFRTITLPQIRAERVRGRPDGDRRGAQGVRTDPDPHPGWPASSTYVPRTTPISASPVLARGIWRSARHGPDGR